MARENLSDLAYKLWPHLAPFVQRAAKSAVVAPGSNTVEVTVHDLAGDKHVGTLADSQAPQFLMVDGSRKLTGSMAFVDGVTIDGMDPSAHIINPDAHHNRASAGNSAIVVDPDQKISVQLALVPGLKIDSGLSVLLNPNSGLILDVAGLRMGDPGTLGVNSINQLVGNTHYHLIDSSANPGAAAKILQTDADGSFRFDTNLLFVDATNDLVRYDTDTLIVDALNDAVWINSGSPDGSAAFNVRSRFAADVTQRLQQIPGQTARIWQILDADGNELIVLTSQGDLQSGNPGFVSGLTGWQISHVGNVEFNNGIFRGELHASVFVLDEFHVSGGTLMVANGGKLRETAVIDSVNGDVQAVWVRSTAGGGSGNVINARTTGGGGSGDETHARNITNFLDVDDPASAHATIFQPGDILRIKTWNGSGLFDQWFRVNYAEDMGTHYRYWVQKVSATLDGVIPAGTAIADYGQKGDGRILLTSDQSFAPYIDIFSIGDAPWTGAAGQIIPHVRLGRLDGVGLAGIGGILQYGIVMSTDLSNSNSPYIKASNLGLGVFKADIQMHDGANPTGLWTAGGHFKLGVDIQNPLQTTLHFDAKQGNLFIGRLTGNHLYWNQATGELRIAGIVNIVNQSDINYANLSGKPTQLSHINSGEGAKLNAGLDSSGNLITKVLPGSNVGTPLGAGLYLGADRMGFYSGSAWRTYMDNTGKFFFAGSSGATIAWDGTDLYGSDGVNVQWYARSTTGKLYAGQGNVFLDRNGLSLLLRTGTLPSQPFPSNYSTSNAITFYDGSRPIAMIVGNKDSSPTPDKYTLDIFAFGPDISGQVQSSYVRISAEQEIGGPNYNPPQIFIANEVINTGLHHISVLAETVTLGGALDTGGSVVSDVTVSGDLFVTNGRLGGGWTPLPLTNAGGTTWANFGGAYQTARYKKVGDVVFLQGLVRRTAGAGQVIATLPAGFRPPAYVLVTTSSNDTWARIDIRSNGEIAHMAGGDASQWVSLNGIYFSTV